ncbi:hypothetical protein ABEB36_013564 [Hypothenemus hampei]|uniref:Uncharacterized protein n=1 Tax=Hypothenemus hampei TaxID=57062 RepID=A0ABD1E5I7_HYPHA
MAESGHESKIFMHWTELKAKSNRNLKQALLIQSNKKSEASKIQLNKSISHSPRIKFATINNDDQANIIMNSATLNG